VPGAPRWQVLSIFQPALMRVEVKRYGAEPLHTRRAAQRACLPSSCRSRLPRA